MNDRAAANAETPLPPFLPQSATERHPTRTRSARESAGPARARISADQIAPRDAGRQQTANPREHRPNQPQVEPLRQALSNGSRRRRGQRHLRFAISTILRDAAEYP